MRLHKYIANCGYTSRRRAELLIHAGRVKVNGTIVTEMGFDMDPEKDRVSINDDRVTPPERLTIILHKLPGYISSTHDTHDRLTVMDLLPRRMREIGVMPVGRLDQDTTGLLVLTNDGTLNHRITHPSFEIEKEYVAEVEGSPSREALHRIEEGILLEGEKTAPAKVFDIQPLGGRTRLHVVISEGRKRQIKKMFDALGHPVISLGRVRIGDLKLGNLPPGQWRKLHPGEIEAVLGKKGNRRPEGRIGEMETDPEELDCPEED